jgi:hypothetical protein
MSLRSFYCSIDVFSAADVDRMLETFEGMAIGTKQRLKKTYSIPAHVRTPYAQKLGATERFDLTRLGFTQPVPGEATSEYSTQKKGATATPCIA